MTLFTHVRLALVFAALAFSASPVIAQVQTLDTNEGESAVGARDVDEAGVKTESLETDNAILAVDRADRASVERCEERIAAVMEGRGVLFASGSARLTPESEELVGELAAILADCPTLPVYVEGHTDADGRAETNLVLSLSRAEAVVDALVAEGIEPRRLYAVGYGASLPIATNDTAAGKAQNRRIVFAFEDIAGKTEGDLR